MRFFRLEPDGDRTAANALEQVTPMLTAAGAQLAVLIVLDAQGVSIADAAAEGADSSLKAVSDLLLKVALDAKELVT